MTMETYGQSGPGPFEVVKPETAYRTIMLDSGAAVPVTLSVTSGPSSTPITVTLQPGEVRAGSMRVISGHTDDCHGYLP